MIITFYAVSSLTSYLDRKVDCNIMEKFIMLMEVLLPVILTLVIGAISRKAGLISKDGMINIKNLISYVLLPVVIFNAVATIQFKMDSLVIVLVIIACEVVAFGIGFLLKRFLGNYGTFTPFLTCAFEGGLLGYSLFVLIAGKENLHYLAQVDLGNILFANTVYMGMLAVADGGKSSVKATVKNLVKVPVFIGTLLGVFVGVTGISSAVLTSSFGGIYTSFIEFFTAPVSVLVLFSIGYEFTLNRRTLIPVGKTILVRGVVMLLLFFAAEKIIFSFTPYEELLHMALMFFFALPASFVIPVYTKKDIDNEYASTTLSLYLLITIGVFTVMAYQNLA